MIFYELQENFRALFSFNFLVTFYELQENFKALFSFNFLVTFYELQENFEALELSVKFFKEKQNCRFDLSLRKISIKSNTKYGI